MARDLTRLVVATCKKEGVARNHCRAIGKKLKGVHLALLTIAWYRGVHQRRPEQRLSSLFELFAEVIHFYSYFDVVQHEINAFDEFVFMLRRNKNK